MQQQVKRLDNKEDNDFSPYCNYAGFTLRSNKDHVFYLNDTVSEDIRHYIGLLEVLRTAEPGDTLTIYINGYGGSLYTSAQIMNAIAKSEAIVTTVACANINSGHAMIWLSGDILEYETGVSIMFHTFSGGGYGKGHDGVTNLQSTMLQMRTLFNSFGTGFFNDEMTRYIFERNTDVWFTDYEGELPNLTGNPQALYKIDTLNLCIASLILNRLENGDVKNSALYDREVLENMVYGDKSE